MLGYTTSRVWAWTPPPGRHPPLGLGLGLDTPQGRHPSWAWAWTPPPLDRMTDRCKNITFAQLRLRAVNIHIFSMMCVEDSLISVFKVFRSQMETKTWVAMVPEQVKERWRCAEAGSTRRWRYASSGRTAGLNHVSVQGCLPGNNNVIMKNISKKSYE